MYELFVLGQLTDRAMSGYLLRHILQQMVGRQRQISFGMIYPLLDRLAQAGYITLTKSVTTGKRPKKVATITATGRQRFFELMGQAVPINPNTDFTYSVKFRYFHQIGGRLRLAILTAYQEYLRGNQAFIAERAAALPLTDIPPADLRDAQRVMRLAQLKTQAALSWVQTEIEEEHHVNH